MLSFHRKAGKPRLLKNEVFLDEGDKSATMFLTRVTAHTGCHTNSIVLSVGQDPNTRKSLLEKSQSKAVSSLYGMR